MSESIKKYSNGEVTIIWKSHLCKHSQLCTSELPEVFDHHKRPWIDPNGASTQQIIAQVKQCPSGALTFYLNGKRGNHTVKQQRVSIEVVKNGPIIVTGPITIKHINGSIEERDNITVFCRCGSSESKPFCDGTHYSVNHESGSSFE